MANNQKIGSGNRNQAPKLVFKGEKFNGDKEQEQRKESSKCRIS